MIDPNLKLKAISYFPRRITNVQLLIENSTAALQEQRNYFCAVSIHTITVRQGYKNLGLL